MSVNGLNKITERILADAQERAEKILSDARVDCERIKKEAEKKANEIRELTAAQTEQKGKDLVARAKASAAMQKRNLLLGCQSDLLEGVFASAKRRLLNSDRESYEELLLNLTVSSMVDQVETEQNNRKLYGDEEEVIPTSYEVLLSEKDREELGEKLISKAKKKLKNRIPEERIESLSLSAQKAPIDGGMILRYGDVEVNCSMEMLFSELRREIEGEVSRILFEQKNA